MVTVTAILDGHRRSVTSQATAAVLTVVQLT